MPSLNDVHLLKGACGNDTCNGQSCFEDEHGYNCICDIGFEGLNCEIEKGIS